MQAQGVRQSVVEVDSVGLGIEHAYLASKFQICACELWGVKQVT